MKKTLILLFVFLSFCSFSQSFEEREKINEGFKKSSDAKIILFKNSLIPKQLDSIQLKSDFLNSRRINYKIIGFRILAIDKNEEVVFSFSSRKNNIISKEFNKKINECLGCEKVKVDLVTINWFTGTYTIRTNQSWNIN
ncbi:hypothetical protein [uncultured Tenacibaculum sp.]|uniref:hypothetical protein n=1 Tax=uncultured Tenacibaculum sp. TaxID=174713 RepID=UPI002629FBDA|nr:hypothetical protein [uncultured Tenacibaculum sp.]